jgi:regulator of nucleoside diphosphate kinase
MSHTDVFIVTRGDVAILQWLKMTPALKRKLETAIAVSSASVPPDVITMNSRLIYIDEESGERRSVRLTYPRDALRLRDGVSVLAPVGTALLGASVGQTIVGDRTPGRLRVAEVVYQPERSRYSPLPVAP